MQCALQLIGANNSIPLQWQNFQHEFPDIKNDGEFWRIGPDHTHTAVDLCRTAGFGVDTAYFDAILARVQAVPDGSNTVIGTYMCQGKMPPSVRARYEAMRALPAPPENLDALIENFDRARTHPDADDCDCLRAAVLHA